MKDYNNQSKKNKIESEKKLKTEDLKMRFNMTYNTFPQKLYHEYIQNYVVPYGKNFKECIDLGCGSGGLLREVLKVYNCKAFGIDISGPAINDCLNDPFLKKHNTEFIQDDILNLTNKKSFQNRFDLIVSHSVFHLLEGNTANKFKLLKNISKPGAIIYLDAPPLILWNAFFLKVAKIAYKMKIAEIGLRLFRPLLVPNRPKSYLKEATKLSYIKDAKISTYLDLSYLNSEDFNSSFEILRKDIIPNDGILTARKVRLTIKRKELENKNKIKILLIHTPILQLDKCCAPLGIMYLASVLKKEGCEVKLIDKDPDYFNFISEIKGFNPDLIGLSFMTPSYGRALRLSKLLKKEFPNTSLCAGGVHVTTRPKDTLKELNLDFVVMGEGERTIVEVYNKLKNKKSLKGVKGVMYKKGQEIIYNGPRELIKNLDKIPFPDRDLFDFKKEYVIYPGMIRGYASKSINLLFGRGCPFNCIFCSSKVMWGRKTRCRSVENLIAEIKHLIDKYGIKTIAISDDTFLINHEKVREFCRTLKKENMNIKWVCNARVDNISEDILKEMKTAGCVHIDFGIESGSDRILKILKKDTNIEMIKNAFKLMKKIKIRTGASFMINNPFETRNDIEKTFNLAKEISADFTTFFYTTPFPGTEIYNLSKQQGWVKEGESFSNEWNVRTAQLPLMINDSGLTKDELMKIRSKMQNHFFIRNYVKPINFVLAFKLASFSLINPKITLKALGEVIKTKRLDSAFEIIFEKFK